MDKDTAFNFLKDLLHKWSPKYIFQLFPEEGKKEDHKKYYRAEISLPSITEPIPKAKVNVNFIVTEHDKKFEVEYTFECEQLKHRLDSTLNANRFEDWIVRLIENKNSIKDVMHMGTEFEYTRIVDKGGNVIDPFTEKLDITKLKTLKKLVDLEESTNIDSPRYAYQLRKKINYALKKADSSKCGRLSRLEIEKVLISIDLGISEWDVKVIIASLKAQDDMVAYTNDVLDWITDIIMAFLHRTKSELKFDMFRYLYIEEITKISSLLLKLFKKEDPTSTGYIPKSKLKDCLEEAKLTNEKENTLLLLYYCPDGRFDYGKFTEYMYEIIYQIVLSQLLDVNLKNFKASFKEACEKLDAKKAGQLTLPQLKDTLIKFPLFDLTLIQKYDLIATVNPNLVFLINYNDFIEQTSVLIQRYTIKNISKMITCIDKGQMPYQEINEAMEYNDFDLFDIFKRHDIMKAGFIDPSDFQKCLIDAKLKITTHEAATIALAADLLHNNQIDYEEFMKHIKQFIKIVKQLNCLLRFVEK